MAIRSRILKRFKRRRPRDIAIVGVDGVGKSTLSRSLQAELGRQGYKTAVLDWPHFTDFAGRVGRVAGLGRTIMVRGSEKQSKKLIMLGGIISWLPTKAAKSRSGKSDVRILERPPSIDAPVLGRIYAGRVLLAFSKAGGKLMEGPLPDVAIFLSLKPEAIAERVKRRGKEEGGWSQLEFRHRGLLDLAKQNDAFRERLEELASKGVWVYEVDASLPREEVLRQVMKLVEEKKLLEKNRKRYLERKNEAAIAFTLEGIERWERGGKISRKKAADLRDKLGKGYAAQFLKQFAIHNAISGPPGILAGWGTIARPVYTAAMRGTAAARRLKGRISEREYELLKRLHSGEAIVLSTVLFLGRGAYIGSLAAAEPELFGILADHFAYKTLKKIKLERVYHKARVGWLVEKSTIPGRKWIEFKIFLERKAKEKIRRKRK